jgi:flagellar assembly factor FliW
MRAILTFVTPPLGFAPLVDFSLDAVDGADGLYALRSQNGTGSGGGAGVRLFVIDASIHLPDYQPTLTRDQSESIGLSSPADAAVLVVVNPGPQATANLMAPIVVNRLTGQCNQVILEDQGWPLKAPLAPSA